MNSTPSQPADTTDLDEMFSAWAQELETTDWQNPDTKARPVSNISAQPWNSKLNSSNPSQRQLHVSQPQHLSSPWSPTDFDELSGEPDSLMSDPRAIHEDFTQDSLMILDLNHASDSHKIPAMPRDTGSMSPHSESSDVGTADLPEDVETPRALFEHNRIQSSQFEEDNFDFWEEDPVANLPSLRVVPPPPKPQDIRAESPQGLSTIMEEQSLEVSDLLLDFGDDATAPSISLAVQPSATRLPVVANETSLVHSPWGDEAPAQDPDSSSLSSVDSLNEDTGAHREPPMSQISDPFNLLDEFLSPAPTQSHHQDEWVVSKVGDSMDTLTRLVHSNENFLDTVSEEHLHSATGSFGVVAPTPDPMEENNNRHSLLDLDIEDFMQQPSSILANSTLNEDNSTVKRLTLGPEVAVNKKLLMTDFDEGDSDHYDPFNDFEADSKRLTLGGEVLANEKFANEETFGVDEDVATEDVWPAPQVDSPVLSMSGGESVDPTSHRVTSQASLTFGTTSSSAPPIAKRPPPPPPPPPPAVRHEEEHRDVAFKMVHREPPPPPVIPPRPAVPVVSPTSVRVTDHGSSLVWQPQPQLIHSPRSPRLTTTSTGGGGGGAVTSAAVEVCQICQKRVYPVERVAATSEKILHKACFRCQKCRNALNLTNFAFYNDELLCQPHYLERFKATGRYDDPKQVGLLSPLTSPGMESHSPPSLPRQSLSNGGGMVRSSSALATTYAPVRPEMEIHAAMKSVQNVRNLWKERDAQATATQRMPPRQSLGSTRELSTCHNDDLDGYGMPRGGRHSAGPHTASNIRQLIQRFSHLSSSEDHGYNNYRKPGALIKRPQSLGDLLEDRDNELTEMSPEELCSTGELPPSGVTKKYAALFSH